ncbi:hypothetical protein FZI85_17235 [Mycobacterium sp. CBMA293]|uniref:hypothetical protein n=1 Tax=unclassified Mycolicibacterium TaxID=2636767 RepID=UPI0012DF38B6|nr:MULTISPECIES: hypothetical protein [unclassified Mycolicibacterium]MUL44468.1 hypothetical protein [Mycolicibacterium sp. CBMA 360]MUL59788.1 hypothetical protein [Mycolicibacterium sp. CBMA 335]MUL68631.1 hypothetical protein [Mycolicibacterium sp. CBMA 311]MUL93978.1 hypothetical protein [Mycolicibacterium sp. CBMA 230]MUM06225.1 hypothetical protein [Mycolicibacterium sp. CBMA 213]
MTAPATGVFPYAPSVVHDYLVSVLDADVRVATKVPAKRPAKLVTITSVPAGDLNNVALSARRLILQCYHADEVVAGQLAETVFAHMKSAKYVQGNGLRNVTVVGTPARLDDPDDSTPRFQMTVDVLLRAAF